MSSNNVPEIEPAVDDDPCDGCEARASPDHFYSCPCSVKLWFMHQHGFPHYAEITSRTETDPATGVTIEYYQLFDNDPEITIVPAKPSELRDAARNPKQ